MLHIQTYEKCKGGMCIMFFFLKLFFGGKFDYVNEEKIVHDLNIQ